MMLSTGGKPSLVKSVLYLVPQYYMTLLQPPTTTIDDDMNGLGSNSFGIIKKVNIGLTG